MTTSKSRSLRDSIAGCLLGTAVGDALGAPFEGLWADAIPGRDELLAGFVEFEGYPRGQFTDDTQLTLATVESIVECGGIELGHIAQSIAELWRTQQVIGPGGACTRAAHRFLQTGDPTDCGAPIGQAGNGTAMRTAILGLYFHSAPKLLRPAVAAVSRITHQDPRSVAGGVAIAEVCRLLASEPDVYPAELARQVADAMEPYDADFAGSVVELAARLAAPRQQTLEWIACAGSAAAEFKRPIITPFVIPTVLASLWAILRNSDSWPQAVASAIGCGGDVDTLGAIVGALAGARLGEQAIPANLRDEVVDAERIRILAVRYSALLDASV